MCKKVTTDGVRAGRSDRNNRISASLALLLVAINSCFMKMSESQLPVDSLQGV